MAAALALALLIMDGPTALAEGGPVSQTLPMTFQTTLYPGSRHSFTFRLFDAASGGTEIWTETTPTKLTVSSSRTISWRLGSVIPFADGLTGPVDFSQQLWVQFTGGGKTPARVKFNVVPYAMWSAESAATGPGTITNTMLADGAVTDEKILGPIGADKVDDSIARDSEVLPTILSRDGADSELDADMLDGQHGSHYATQQQIEQLQSQLALILNGMPQIGAHAISASSAYQRDPRIAMDGAGNGIATWVEGNGTSDRLWASEFLDASGWRPAKLVDSDSGSVDMPQISMNSSGNAVAIWRSQGGGQRSIWANTYQPGAGWGPPQTLEQSYRDADSPRVAIDAGGNAVAVWVQYAGSVENVFASRYISGVGWNAAELIQAGSNMSAHPQVGIDSSGAALAVWFQSDGANWNIWTNRCTSNGIWGTAEIITVGIDPRVAVYPDGKATILATSVSSTTVKLWAIHYESGWGPPRELDSGPIGSISSHQIVAGGDGGAVAVWLNAGNVAAARYVPGDGWGSAQGIEPFASAAWEPQVADDALGNCIAVWNQSDGTRTIWASKFLSGTGWGQPTQLESYPNLANSPRVAASSTRKAIVVWEQETSTTRNIYANVLRW